MNWYIGQRIVAIADHSQGIFKKGDEFFIKGIRKCLCKCNDLDLNIGVGDEAHAAVCHICKNIYPTSAGWFGETRFTPLQSRPELSELTDEMILTAPATKELQTA